ncbi:MAG: type II secretion system F family protein [Actinomycetales bacterium]|nr:type II secretion system F family protein [Actinomycetales bacterium]
MLAAALAVRPDLLPERRPRRDRRRTAAPRGSWATWRWPIALLAGLIIAAATRWLVVGAVVAVTIVGLPALVTTAKRSAARIDRLEAVEDWTRRLADLLRSGAGLDQALQQSAVSAPEGIAPEIDALAGRLLARWPTADALLALAGDIDDASADLVVAALLLGAERRGPGLADALAAAADSVAADVAARRAVEAERAKPRATAQAVTLITLGVVAVGSFNGEYLQPYRDPLGQLVLAALAAAFAACLWWIRGLTVTAPAPRILAGARSSEEVPS